MMKKTVSLACAVMILSANSPSFAGFEIRGAEVVVKPPAAVPLQSPQMTPKAVAVPEAINMPPITEQPAVEMQELAPVIQTEKDIAPVMLNDKAEPAKVTEDMPADKAVDDTPSDLAKDVVTEKEDEILAEKTADPENDQPVLSKAEQKSFAVVDGFGSRIDLATAARQIVPKDYQIAFADQTDLKTTITWEGGKDWLSVLSEALAPKDLRADIKDDEMMVVIGPADAAKTEDASASQVGQEPQAKNEKINPFRRAPLLFSNQHYVGQEDQPKTAGTIAVYDMSGIVLETTGKATQAPDQQSEMRTAGDDVVTFTPATDEPVLLVNSADEPPSLPPITTAVEPEPVQDVAVAVEPVVITPQEKQTSVQPIAEVIKMNDKDQKNLAMTWQAESGFLLRDILKDWSDKAGTDLYWSTDYDYKMNVSKSFTGSYEKSVESLLDLFSNVRPQPYGQLHKGTNGPAVLVIKTYNETP